ncbi:hypothetical protein ACOME3_010776 [Neoechinorhynchus agilis]
MISTQVPVFGLFAFFSDDCCSTCLTAANFILLAAIGVPKKAFSFSPREYCKAVRCTAIELAKIAWLSDVGRIHSIQGMTSNCVHFGV